MATFTHEHHVHLYGCLTAEDVFALGRPRWQARERALQRYAQRHAHVCGAVPPYRAFWSSRDGVAQLRRYYEVDRALSFAQFQAKFDLLPALFPLRQTELYIWQHVLAKHRRTGLRYVEYRFIFPSQLADPHAYLQAVNALLAKCVAESGGSFQPRLALSLDRSPAQARAQYLALRAMLDADPRGLRYITAIDLCGCEEEYPPVLYRTLFAEILRDNRRGAQKLAILLHVGETFTAFSLPSAVRRILQAHVLGVHRVGHAIALGLDGENLRGTQVQETRQERLAHLHWLLHEEGRELQDFGYHIATSVLRRERAWLRDGNTPPCYRYDDEMLDELQTLQNAAMRWAQAHRVCIEACPTSNLHLGKVGSPLFHPLRAFSRHDLCVTLASDDPGIFRRDLQQEARFCQDELCIPAHFMRRMQANQLPLCSEQLC